MSHLAELTAVELLAGYRAGDFTPVDATEAALERIEQHDGALNAFVLVDRESALESARGSAQRWAAGETLGPGDGVPTSIKDIFPTVGWPTLRGSKLIDAAGPWDFDAPCVARLRETGAVLLGKTTTPEFAWKGTTDSGRFGVTTNPWDPALTSGGSSGGAASAVGAGMGPWAVGTDGGGSVRIPAAFTGTVAIKATYGTVPMYPASPFGTLAHAGPMARTVTDTALLLDVIAGFDARDWSALPSQSRPFSADLAELEVDGGSLAGVRIGYSPTLGFGSNDPEVEARVDEAVEVLASLGAQVERVDPDIADPVEAFHVLWFTGAAKVLEAYGPGALEQVDPGLRAGIEQYADASALDYLSATGVRMDMGVRMGAFHGKYDLLVTPTMPIPAFDASRQAPAGWPSELWTSWTPYTIPFNMTQQPAVSVPCGLTGAGLPVGLQIVAARTRDRSVLRAARAYELASGEKFSAPVTPVARAARTVPADEAAR
ncbi:amidase [Nesterenkonia sandarakina]|uniref:Aspartyl-tRNA(Asn)/glutamyl-tRNA(Gln) amidotransferase subunit A n=1 Tax=Nesterenkonia sandarakina TaxID=272918 RepID=A0A2T0YQ54_9MICC|nr:amidase [Nesterenkonia sandarakina]PRZ17520.1 aspartyl-tRNA(Asn)/glutamyl-tRNA(Gln) amidotransferase subunit A [Nesterenkonia sandarakina]